MATTTTNFGWDIPQSTDLVKDGATAIAALGQDIDTAFIDLKGGTTGQVLAKASGTDLDFSWVAQDDSNAIQNAIVDAKGDLIAATGADTPARLAVGTNGQVLTADSTASTGIKWATPSAGGGGLTLVSSTTFSAVNSYAIDSVFTSTYANYRIIFEVTDTSSSDATMVFRASAADNTTANYSWNSQYAAFGANALSNQGGTSATSITSGFGMANAGTKGGIFVMDILNPQAAKVTNGTVQTLHQGGYQMFGHFRFNTTTQFDGFKFSATAMTGTCRIYGYQNS